MTNVVPIPKANGHSYSFEEFWNLCPNKSYMMFAQYKWKEITSEKGYFIATYDKDTNQYIPCLLQATPAELVEGMRRYRQSLIDPQTYKLKEGGRWAVNPSKWLSQARWRDG